MRPLSTVSARRNRWGAWPSEEAAVEPEVAVAAVALTAATVFALGKLGVLKLGKFGGAKVQPEGGATEAPKKASSASKVALLAINELAFAYICSVMVLGEPTSWLSALGTAVVFIGGALVAAGSELIACIRRPCLGLEYKKVPRPMTNVSV